MRAISYLFGMPSFDLLCSKALFKAVANLPNQPF